MQIGQALKQAQTQLEDSESPRLDAELLLSHVLGKRREFLLTWPETELTSTQRNDFADLLQQRINGKPVAYLTGVKAFWDLELAVNEAVLIPRPETELLIELALELLPATPLNIADLGTGSGAIALALAKTRTDWQVVATDSSPAALALAQRNAATLQVPNIAFRLGSWLQALEDAKFDAIVSNPPYIDAQDRHLQEGDVRFEPRTALVAADDGMQDLAQIAQQAAEKLKPGGVLLLEHGADQGERLRSILRQSGYYAVTTVKDLAGLERVTHGRV